MPIEPKRLTPEQLAAALYDLWDYGLNDWCRGKLESIEKHIAALEQELAAAEAVCEIAGRYTSFTNSQQLDDALDAWRKAKEQT